MEISISLAPFLSGAVVALFMAIAFDIGKAAQVNARKRSPSYWKIVRSGLTVACITILLMIQWFVT